MKQRPIGVFGRESSPSSAVLRAIKAARYLSPMDLQNVREMALDMPGTAEKDHFGRPSYSVKKKIYMTFWIEEQRAVIKLTPAQQAELCEEYEALSPVPNKWGKHGWTNVDLVSIDERRFKYLLDLAWRNVSPKWLLPTRVVPPKV